MLFSLCMGRSVLTSFGCFNTSQKTLLWHPLQGCREHFHMDYFPCPSPFLRLVAFPSVTGSLKPTSPHLNIQNSGQLAHAGSIPDGRPDSSGSSSSSVCCLIPRNVCDSVTCRDRLPTRGSPLCSPPLHCRPCCCVSAQGEGW